MSDERKATSQAQTLSTARLLRSLGNRVVLPARRVGPATVGLLVVGLGVRWLVVGPSNGVWNSFVGRPAAATEAVWRQRQQRGPGRRGPVSLTR